jgi:Trk K+ transport system NAD-binding subunit
MPKSPMRRSTRGLLILLALLPLTVLLFSLLYMLGENFLEGNDRDFWSSLEWAAETLTTTGYGADAHWNHPLMVALVIVAQFSGLFLVFMIFPIYVLPYFEERFEARLPRSLPKGENLFLVFHYSPAVAGLIGEFQRFERHFVILEQDREAARAVQERGLPVLYQDLSETRLPAEAAERLAAVVANGSDQDNATLVILLREIGFEGQILAFAQTPLHRLPLQQLGATAVYTPKHLLAAALTTRASGWLHARVRNVHELGEDVGVFKLRIPRNSSLAGKTLLQAGLRRLGVSIVGIWTGGQFTIVPPPSTVLAAGSVVVAIGSHDALDTLGARALPLKREGPFVVCGFGEVGSKVTQMLQDAKQPVLVVNDRELDGVGIVGNVLDPDVLKAIDEARPRAIILAIGNDSETQFLAAVVRDSLPDVPLMARVNQSHAVDRLYRLGVDYALSIDSVAGELLATQLLGEEFVDVEPELRVSRVLAHGLAGQHPWRLEAMERSGCKVVALARGSKVMVSFNDDFELQEDDELFVCGSPDSIDHYLEVFPKAQPQSPLQAVAG